VGPNWLYSCATERIAAAICRTHPAEIATRNVADFAHCGIEILGSAILERLENNQVFSEVLKY